MLYLRCLMILSLVSLCFGQRTSFDSGEVTTAEYINDSLNLNQNEIFARCLDWATETYVSSKGAIEEKDRDAGIIVIKSQCFAQQMLLDKVSVRYHLRIRIKDNKIKMTFETGKCIDKKTGEESAGKWSFPSKEGVKTVLQNYSDLHNKLLAKLKAIDNF